MNKSMFTIIISLIAVSVSLIAVFVTIWGNIYNASKQRELQQLNLRAESYASFLGQLELLIPTTRDQTLTDNDKIKELNKALTILLTRAPDCVIKKINEEIFNGDKTKKISLGRPEIKKLQLILHNDINGQLKCSSDKLIEGDFPHFPFQ